MRCHEINYEIIGNSMQVIEVDLDPRETVMAEASAMTRMEEGIIFEAKMGDGSDVNAGVFGKLFGAGKRMITGESIFTTHFSNAGGSKSRVAFAALYPGDIITANMAEIGEQIVCHKDAFLRAALGTKLDVALNRKRGASLFDGEGFFLEPLRRIGTVRLQNLAFSRMADRIIAAAPQMGGDDKGEGSV